LIDNGVMQILDRILDPNNPSARPHVVIKVTSTGVKAGAGVAVMNAFLIIIAAAVYFCMRTRRNKRARIARIAPVHSIDNQPHHTAPSELSHDEWRRELPQEPDKY
jgi:ABC-type nickel/cobalt efflux system permease component RcnA